MNIKEVRRTVGQIKGSLFKNSNSYSIGMLKSHFKGTGLQFKEHQVYTHGDDVRFIDWKILAKSNNPYIKTFEEERNVEIVVVIDVTSSMFTGVDGVSKLQAAIEITCLLYLLSKESSDFVHVLILTETIINIPKCSGEEGITRLISILEKENILTENGKVNISYEVSHGRDTQKEFVSIMKQLKKRREVVLLSDFNNFFDDDSLKKLLLRANVHAFQLLSPLDEAFKFPFSVFGKNPVTGKSSLTRENLDGRRNTDHMFGKKIKKLRVEERYMENFVKEML